MSRTNQILATAVIILTTVALVVGLTVLFGEIVTRNTSSIKNQNPTGCAYGDSIPVDSEKCSAENFADKTTTITPATLPSVGGSGK